MAELEVAVDAIVDVPAADLQEEIPAAVDPLPEAANEAKQSEKKLRKHKSASTHPPFLEVLCSLFSIH